MDNIPNDVEEIVIAWLNTMLGTNWAAYGDKPDPLPDPDQFVLVDRTGGPREAMVMDRAAILIEVYQKSDRLAAKNKANEIADRIVELNEYHNISGASINSVVHAPDLIGQYERYNVYCDINCRR